MTQSTNSSLGHVPDNASKPTVLARRFSGHLKIPSAVQNFFGYFKNVHATGASSHDKSKASITATEPPTPTPSASKCASSRTEYASTCADVDDNQIKAVLSAGEFALTNAESDETRREGHQPLEMTGRRKSIGESIERDIENSTLAKSDDQEEEYRFDAKQDDVDRDSDAVTPEATNDGPGYPPGTSNLKVTHDNRKNSNTRFRRPTTSNSHMHTAPDRRSRSPQQHLHPSRKRSRSVVDDEDHYHRDASALVLSKPAAKRVRRVDNRSLFTSFSGSRPQNEEQRRSENDGHSRNGLGSSRTDGAFERGKSVNAEVAPPPSSPTICRRKRGRDESQDNVQDQLGLTFFQDSQVISGGDRVGPISESEPAGRSRKRLKWTAGGPGNSHNHRFNSINEKVHHPLALHGDNCGNAALIRQESEAQLQLSLVESSAEVPPACVRRRKNRLDALWHRTVLISPESGHAIPYDSPHPRNSEEWHRREEEDTRKWRNRFERVFD